MVSRYFRDFNDSPMYRKNQDQDLLRNGWRPLYRDLDLAFLSELLSNDPWKLSQKSLDLMSRIADTLGRKDYAWWANILNVFSEDLRYDIDEFWDYITPEPVIPNQYYTEMLTSETPIVQIVNRDTIPIDYVLKRLQEITVTSILQLLGIPDRIIQSYEERYFYYPIQRFKSWEKLDAIGTIFAYWSKQDIWLQINSGGGAIKYYTLMAKELAPLLNQATKNLAVMLSGYQTRVGKIHSQYPIDSFPSNIQSFTTDVKQAVLQQEQLAILVQGKPGTGKTAWTQAVAKEILSPLGYVVFILDHDAVENFIPPSYLERICLIINEADNLAQDRASQAAQWTNKTEHILSLLDGTLYRSVIDDFGIQDQQRLVVLMTCNTTDRLDPAFLRKGRVDLTYEFTHQFV
jgi:hypothetical protein